MNVAYNMDCMDGMKQYPDKYFDLAVVDPPYGDACSQDVQVERERERGGTASEDASTSTSRSLAQQLPQEREREKRSQPGELARKAQVPPWCAGRGELGRQSMQKNHFVGCSSGSRVF